MPKGKVKYHNRLQVLLDDRSMHAVIELTQEMGTTTSTMLRMLVKKGLKQMGKEVSDE